MVHLIQSFITTIINSKLEKQLLLKKGEKIAIVASGASVDEALKARQLLEEENIFPEITNMHTIKPIDKEMIKNLSQRRFKNIITVEEHNIIGGLGSAMAEKLSYLGTNTKFIEWELMTNIQKVDHIIL